MSGTSTALPVRVGLREERIAVDDPFATFVALRSRFGEREVALYESLGGPDIDNRAALIQVGRLVEISVRDRRVELDGDPAISAHVRERLVAAGLVDEAGDALPIVAGATVWDVARACEAAFALEGAASDRFDFGFSVVLGYEVAAEIENLSFEHPGSDDLPDVVLTAYASTVSFDLVHATATVIATESPLWDSRYDEVAGALRDAAAAPVELPADPAAPGTEVADSLGEAEYLELAEVALDDFRAGEISLVQLGNVFRVRGPRDDLAVYARMRRDNPSPYMAFIPVGEYAVLSASPELHVRVSGDVLLMRPIAGTARRGADEEQNARNREWLLADDKEAAEHVMLVDLCRNDLGRVAVTGSVTVDQLMTVETYSHVFHLVSTVSATLRPGRDVWDVVCATFPAGTMTGAPKLRAIQIIEELENSRRGFYAGVFGLVGVGGFANLALSIRTVVAGPDGYSLRASAGVVIDSSPQSEWNETLAKMGAPARATTGRDLL
jgi:anthranilate synthase component 1